MREIFIIGPSRRQRRALLAVYLAAALAAAACVEPRAFAVLLALLLALVGWRESRRLEARTPLALDIRAGRAGIGLEQGGQSYFFAKYKVYACRWFAILSLVNGCHHRTLILNPDCFHRVEDYRRFRYRLGTARDAD